MIEFRQKEFTEYDAMIQLYTELKRSLYGGGGVYFDRHMWGDVIKSDKLIPLLKGNNVIIERFVISTSFFHKDRYRMYLKVGARAKMPDGIRLGSEVNKENLGHINFNFNPGHTQLKFNNNQQQQQSTFSTKLFFEDNNKQQKQQKKKKDKKKGGGNNNNGGSNYGGSYNIGFDISHEVTELIGDVCEYNKKERSLVLEFRSIRDAIKCLCLLPFGLNYKIYLLDN